MDIYSSENVYGISIYLDKCLFYKQFTSKISSSEIQEIKEIYYNLSIEDYINMVNKQEGKCLICNQLPKEGKILVVDHNHTTGKIRGLLCHHCNLGIGFLGDDKEGILKALKYLIECDGV